MKTSLGELLRTRPWPLVMGIVNVTPDSFSDGGETESLSAAAARAQEYIADGADIIDIGGESTRPGASPVSAEVELERVVPLVRHLAGEYPEVLLSVDTRRREVAEAALKAGAGVVNDVSGGRFSDGMFETVAAAGAGMILCHSRGEPSTMRQPGMCVYDDVVAEVAAALKELGSRALAAGIAAENLVFDPAFGFAKNAGQDLALALATKRLSREVGPLMAAHSRKSFLGEILGEPDAKLRLGGSLAFSLYAAREGAAVLRVHDVRETVDALRLQQKLNQGDGATWTGQ